MCRDPDDEERKTIDEYNNKNNGVVITLGVRVVRKRTCGERERESGRRYKTGAWPAHPRTMNTMKWHANTKNEVKVEFMNRETMWEALYTCDNRSKE